MSNAVKNSVDANKLENLVDNSLEDIISKVLIDLRIREQVRPYIEEWMFTKDAYKALAMTILKPEFFGKTFDPKNADDTHILLVTIKSYYPRLTEIDINIIEDILDEYRPVSDRDIRPVFNIVEKFIQKLLLWRGSDYIAKNDTKKADYYLTKGHNFKILADESVDPTNMEMLRHLRSLDFPEGGLVMKSSLGLVNEKSTYGGYCYGDLIAVCAPPKTAKCLGKGTKVVMYNGTLKRVEDVKVGDQLLGPDSKVRTVDAITSGTEQMYWVRQSKAMDYRVNESHILSLMKKTFDYKKDNKTSYDEEICNISLVDYLKLHEGEKCKLKGYKVPVEYESVSKVYNPYLIGLWLNNGTLMESVFTIGIGDLEVLNYIEESFKGDKYLLDIQPADSDSLRIEVFCEAGSHFPFIHALHNSNMYNNRHIPHKYMTSSRQDRLQLLAGMLDGNVTFNLDKNIAAMSSSNGILLDQVCRLCWSLGLGAVRSKNTTHTSHGNFTYYTVKIYGDLSEIPLKLANRRFKKQNEIENPLQTDITVEVDVVDEYYGFTLKEDPLFLLEDFTVTHNTTFMCQEGAALADQGFKVAHIWVGDDPITKSLAKYRANILDKTISQVNQQDTWEKYHNMCHNQMKNLRAWHYPALSRTVGEILNSAKNLKNEFNFDILIIDYDLNIKPCHENMYESGGILYATLKGFAQSSHCAVMVGTQPKQHYYYEEILPGNAPAESSKKSHAIDFLINFGRNSECKRVGKCHIPYIRNGESEVTSNVEFLYEKAAIREISNNKYEEIIAKSAIVDESPAIDEGFFRDPLERRYE